MKRHSPITALFLLALFHSGPAAASEYYVASDGDDGAPGSSSEPWRTIQRAADALQPGDTVSVHAGVYREWVNPARGGTSASPITYRALDGEDVYIKGSERVTTWTHDGSVWHAVIPNSTFGALNPYATTFTGDYLTSGATYHLGEVYLDGQPYSEVLTLAETQNAPGTWYAAVDGTDTTLTANFDAADPNAANAEINVREYAFFPSKVGLGYITVRGFHIMQGATQWAPPTAYPQDGVIGPNFGMAWTIENNYISDGKTVCVSGGLGSGDHSQSITQSGNHVIRHNTIERCGQAGIAGSHGLVASTISGNLIQDIHTPNYHFGGYECAGIKIHTAVDVLIEDNVIRRVGSGAFGVWLDWQAQGSRLTRNVMYDLGDAVMLLEANHGPTLIDDNVLIGASFNDQSEATIFVHNLTSAPIGLGLTDGRTPSYFTPHTTDAVGTATHASADNKYFNNIFVSRGLDGVSEQPGYAADYNVFYAGANQTTWGDAHSVSDGLDPTLTTTSLPNGVEVAFKANSAPADVACPLITHDVIGLATLTMQGIENHDGSPITIDHDLVGAARDATHPTAGPLEMLGADNSIQVIAGADLPGSGGGSSGGSGGSGTGVGGATSGGSGGSATAASGGTSANAGGAGKGGGGAGAGGGTSGSSARGSAGSTSGGMTAGAGDSGGNGNAGADKSGVSGAKAATGTDSGGCACTVPVAREAPLGTLLSGLLLASALLRRRRVGESGRHLRRRA